MKPELAMPNAIPSYWPKESYCLCVYPDERKVFFAFMAEYPFAQRYPKQVIIGPFQDYNLYQKALRNDPSPFTWEKIEAFYKANTETAPEPQGTKHDEGKPRFTLVPPNALEEVMLVLEHGAAKYGVGNWQKVEDSEHRYINAAVRHLLAYLQGQALDPESKRSHLAHAIASLMFVLDKEITTNRQTP